MNGTQSEARHSGSGFKGEDLDVVLGRFKNWAAAQRAKTPNHVLPNDAREVSYEQALRASSYRRPADIDIFHPPAKPETKAEAIGQPAAVADSSQKSNGAPAGHLRKQDISKQDEPAELKTSPAENQKPAAPALDTSACAPAATGGKDGQTKGVRRDIKRPSTRKGPQTAISIGKTVPAFRDVMEGTAALTASPTSESVGVERGKTQALTVRVSDVEQARIQACAAQANLSVSAYLRQCALGVDELRVQVQFAMAALPPPKIVEPGLASIPGIFGRFAAGMLGRFRKSKKNRSPAGTFSGTSNYLL